MSQQWNGFNQQRHRNINILIIRRPKVLSGNAQSEQVATGEVFKQRYYRNIKTLGLCRPVITSGNVQSEHVAEGENFQTTILLEH